MIDEYQFLSDQFNKIQTHFNYISFLKQTLTNTFFKNGLLFELAKAQKEYLNSPASVNRARRLKDLNKKMINILNTLEPIAEDTDISEMKDVIRKILVCPDSQKLKLAYKNAKELFEQKLLKHNSLIKDEKQILKTTCLKKCKSTIKKQENQFPALFKDTHKKLKQNAQIFNDTIAKLKEITMNIDKKKHLGYNGTTIAQVAGSALSGAIGYGLYFSNPILSAASLSSSAILLASTKLRPLRWAATNKAAVPLAKSSADSAYSVITNSAFYEGLIHAYMKDFIEYTKKSKK